MKELWEVWKDISGKRPLIYHLTNSVAMDFSANVTLAIGASPVMSHHPLEAQELASVADGILVNTGTPAEPSFHAMKNALSTACCQEKPVLLDPVGYGVTSFRKEMIRELIDNYRFSVIKGNGAEISLLAGGNGKLKGVDSLSVEDLPQCVGFLARKYSTVVAATGEIDLVSDGNSLFRIKGGSSRFGRITASGCIAGSVICACMAASGEVLYGTLAGLVAVGIAAERASLSTGGPGSFAVRFLDELAFLTPEDFMDPDNRINIEEVNG